MMAMSVAGKFDTAVSLMVGDGNSGLDRGKAREIIWDMWKAEAEAEG